jgi:hypothetical protein
MLSGLQQSRLTGHSVHSLVANCQPWRCRRRAIDFAAAHWYSSSMQFPAGKNITGEHPFSITILEKSLAAIFSAKREVTGFLRISCGTGGVYFLFFLKNSIYAAGKYFDHRPKSMTVKDFFSEVVSRTPEDMTASLHETDPMLIKNLLIFIQDEPTVKAPVSMIDLYAIVQQIAKEKSEALVVLESDGFFNFFYFHNGQPAMAHFSETCTEADGLPIDEQLMLYAYRPEKKTYAYTFRNIDTTEAADSDDGSHANIRSILDTVLSTVHAADVESGLDRYSPSGSENVPSPGKVVRICLRDGVDKGASRSLTVPFTIGRKEGELIISDPLVSKRHAIVREIGGSLVIEDLGSTNGTYVNDVEIKLQQLVSGDLIKIGSSIFEILPDL